MNSEERDWALNSVICNHCAGKYLCLFKRDFFPDEYMKARCIAFILKVEDAEVPILLVERPFWVWVGADGGFVAKSCVSAVLRFSLWPQSSFPGTSGPLGTPNSQALDPQRAGLQYTSPQLLRYKGNQHFWVHQLQSQILLTDYTLNLPINNKIIREGCGSNHFNTQTPIHTPFPSLFLKTVTFTARLG